MVSHLKLYYVDMKYIRDLHRVDQHVMSVSPQTGKEDRPFIGVITIVGDKKYCIPLTSGNKEKFNKKKNAVDFIKIPDEGKKDENGAFVTIGGINLNNMIPIDDSVIHPLDIKIHTSDTSKQRADKKRLTKELDWCQRNEDLIARKANRLYLLRNEHPEQNISLTRRCCNFKKLEQVLEKYLGKTNQADGYLIEIKSPDQLAALQASGIPFQKAETSDGTIIVKVKQEHKEAAKSAIQNAQNGLKR